MKSIIQTILAPIHSLTLTRINIWRMKNKQTRCLEIGPGAKRIDSFETLNVVPTRTTDYVCDATKSLPFGNDTFDVVYASHIIEHIPWYQLEDTILEWLRVLKVGGHIEIWTPDALKISKAFISAEEQNSTKYQKDDWSRFNEDKDPCKWFCGRIFSYGDGTGRKGHHNWHVSAFSPRYLSKLLVNHGFEQPTLMDANEVRGYDHGWVNLGLRAKKQ
jgi:hypothetical protein